jgi:hypothetical protein
MNVWFWGWAIWLAFAIIWEGITLLLGFPLTKFKRKFVLHTKLGSATMGAFLVWITYHFLFAVPEYPIYILDLVAILVGMAIGIIGWSIRTDRLTVEDEIVSHEEEE